MKKILYWVICVCITVHVSAKSISSVGFAPSNSNGVVTLSYDTVEYSLTNDSDIDSVLWEFEGANIALSTSLTPKVTYDDEGMFDVTLTYYYNGISTTISKSNYAKVIRYQEKIPIESKGYAGFPFGVVTASSDMEDKRFLKDHFKIRTCDSKTTRLIAKLTGAETETQIRLSFPDNSAPDSLVIIPLPAQITIIDTTFVGEVIIELRHNRDNKPVHGEIVWYTDVDIIDVEGSIIVRPNENDPLEFYITDTNYTSFERWIFEEPCIEKVHSANRYRYTNKGLKKIIHTDGDCSGLRKFSDSILISTAPQIEVGIDTLKINYGDTAYIPIKNTGDAPLRIDNSRDYGSRVYGSKTLFSDLYYNYHGSVSDVTYDNIGYKKGYTLDYGVILRYDNQIIENKATCKISYDNPFIKDMANVENVGFSFGGTDNSFSNVNLNGINIDFSLSEELSRPISNNVISFEIDTNYNIFRDYYSFRDNIAIKGAVNHFNWSFNSNDTVEVEVQCADDEPGKVILRSIHYGVPLPSKIFENVGGILYVEPGESVNIPVVANENLYNGKFLQDMKINTNALTPIVDLPVYVYKHEKIKIKSEGLVEETPMGILGFTKDTLAFSAYPKNSYDSVKWICPGSVENVSAFFDPGFTFAKEGEHEVTLIGYSGGITDTATCRVKIYEKNSAIKIEENSEVNFPEGIMSSTPYRAKKEFKTERFRIQGCPGDTIWLYVKMNPGDFESKFYINQINADGTKTSCTIIKNYNDKYDYCDAWHYQAYVIGAAEIYMNQGDYNGSTNGYVAWYNSTASQKNSNSNDFDITGEHGLNFNTPLTCKIKGSMPNYYKWGLNDSIYSYKPEAPFTIKAEGKHIVKLISGDCTGLDTLTKVIDVKAPPLIAVSIDSMFFDDSLSHKRITVYNNGKGPLELQLSPSGTRYGTRTLFAENFQTLGKDRIVKLNKPTDYHPSFSGGFNWIKQTPYKDSVFNDALNFGFHLYDGRGGTYFNFPFENKVLEDSIIIKNYTLDVYPSSLLRSDGFCYGVNNAYSGYVHSWYEYNDIEMKYDKKGKYVFFSYSAGSGSPYDVKADNILYGKYLPDSLYSLNKYEFLLSSGDSAVVNITVNRDDLYNGLAQQNLVISSNDSSNEVLSIPVIIETIVQPKIIYSGLKETKLPIKFSIDDYRYDSVCWKIEGNAIVEDSIFYNYMTPGTKQVSACIFKNDIEYSDTLNLNIDEVPKINIEYAGSLYQGQIIKLWNSIDTLNGVAWNIGDYVIESDTVYYTLENTGDLHVIANVDKEYKVYPDTLLLNIRDVNIVILHDTSCFVNHNIEFSLNTNIEADSIQWISANDTITANNFEVSFSDAGTKEIFAVVFLNGVKYSKSTSINCLPLPKVNIAYNGAMFVDSVMSFYIKPGYKFESIYWKVENNVITNDSVNYSFKTSGYKKITAVVDINGIEFFDTIDIVIWEVPKLKIEYAGSVYQGQTLKFWNGIDTLTGVTWNISDNIIQSDTAYHTLENYGNLQIIAKAIKDFHAIPDTVLLEIQKVEMEIHHNSNCFVNRMINFSLNTNIEADSIQWISANDTITANNFEVCFSDAGTKEIQVVAYLNGVKYSKSTAINCLPLPKVNIAYKGAMFVDSIISFYINTEYEFDTLFWDINGVNIQKDTANFIFHSDGFKDILLTAYKSGMCIKDTLRITINKNPLGVNNVFGDKVIIYPNPFYNDIYLNSTNEFDRFKIYTLLGRIVKQGIISDNKITLQSLPSGNYIIELNNRKASFKVNIIKK
ncbi:T9SS type A sorting domain-containing protein [Bacteroidales bacterium]|nr:T9SS type A sorting domain-containing protein [Bacteroidales bacterium]